jgi:hypothetical protein
MNRLLVERPLSQDPPPRGKRGPARTVTVNLAESPLGWLKARALVSERQYEAGEMLRRDWEQGGLAAPVTMNWDGAPQDKGALRAFEGGHPTVRQVAARRRVDAAIRDVGTGLADLLWRLVCAGEGMRDAETALGWPARTGRVVLAIALDRLADHYRLK